MSKRVCAQPGCPTLIPQGRSYCTPHTHARDYARGTAEQRGYNAEYRRQRTLARQQVDQGGVTCWRCRQPINPGEPFDLGHDDNNRDIIRGPEHPKCNRATNTRRARTT